MTAALELGSKVEMRSAPGMNLPELIALHTGAESGFRQPLPSPHCVTVSSQTSKFRIALLAEIITSDVSLLVTFNQVIDGVSKNAGVPGKVPHDFRRTAVRNLVRAGVAPSAAMKIVGHKTEPIYRRYAIAEEKTLIESADELEQFHAFDQQYAKPSK
jgi:hypothetical protein